MNDDDIPIPEVGKTYAYVSNVSRRAHPEAATILGDVIGREVPCNNTVRARVLHPDEGAREVEVLLGGLDLCSSWNEPPSEHFWFEPPDKPWSEIAAEGYLRVQRQRVLASRLSALGIRRERMHYAGLGGTTVSRGGGSIIDDRLVLSFDELEALVTMAEELREQRK